MAEQDLPGALRARRSMLLIAADDDLDKDAKLFAFCLVAYLASPERLKKIRTGKGPSWARAVGDMMFAGQRSYRMEFMGQTTDFDAVYRVRRIIADDIPRYRVPYNNDGCPVLKTRGKNAGKPCGKRGTTHWTERDPMTGEGKQVSYCSSHLTKAHEDERLRTWQEWEANGKPEPPANVGGILARHFSTDWAAMYAWADPHQVPLPGGKPMTPPRPKLRLVTNDD